MNAIIQYMKEITSYLHASVMHLEFHKALPKVDM